MDGHEIYAKVINELLCHLIGQVSDGCVLHELNSSIILGRLCIHYHLRGVEKFGEADKIV